MRTGAWLTLWGVVAGCGWFEADQGVGVVGGPSVASAPARDLLVWTAAEAEDGSLAYRTQWVRQPMGQAATVVGRTEGLVVASDQGLHRLQPQVETLSRYGCEGEQVPWTVTRWQIAPVAGDGPVHTVQLLDPPNAGQTADDGAEYDDSLMLVGTVGPYAFFHAGAYVYGCGAAHGSQLAVAEVIDVRTGKPVELLEPVEADALGPLRQTAWAVLSAGENGAVADGPDDLEHTRWVPRWTSSGALVLDAQFTAPACYACSDGAWASYTRSHTLALDRVPRRLQPWMQWPSAFDGVAGVPMEPSMGGYSELPLGAEARDALLARW